MPTTDPTIPPRDDDAPVPETDRLLARLVDGEATADDRRRFETLAADDPGLWRELAARERDARRLEQAFDETVAALGGSLPAPARRAVRLPVALSGWAATIVVRVGGWLVWRRPAPVAPLSAPTLPVESVRTAESSRYVRDAPTVIGEMAPVLLETTEHDDGTVTIRYLRRIEEETRLAQPLPDDHDDAATGRR